MSWFVRQGQADGDVRRTVRSDIQTLVLTYMDCFGAARSASINGHSAHQRRPDRLASRSVFMWPLLDSIGWKWRDTFSAHSGTLFSARLHITAGNLVGRRFIVPSVPDTTPRFSF